MLTFIVYSTNWFKLAYTLSNINRSQFPKGILLQTITAAPRGPLPARPLRQPQHRSPAPAHFESGDFIAIHFTSYPIPSGTQGSPGHLWLRYNCYGSCPVRPDFGVEVAVNGKDEYFDPVFFLETSGSGQLNVRQVCSVESMARLNNPNNMTVYVIFLDVDVNKYAARQVLT